MDLTGLTVTFNFEPVNRVSEDSSGFVVALSCEQVQTRPAEIVDAPSGQAAYVLTSADTLVVQTRPTGAQYPVNHPLVPTYQISIDRVWALPLSNLVGFQPGAGNYVLQIVWTDEDSGNWHRRTFYGVTISSRSFAPQSIETEFVDGQEFAAQYFVADSGSSWSEPGDVPAPAAVVYWNGPDGYFPLYNYASSGGASFILADGATTDGHARIAGDGSSITFDGASGPVLATTAGGVTVGQLCDAYPTAQPQLVFCAPGGGTGPTGQALAVVDTSGFWCRVLSDAPSGGALASGAAFVFQYQGQAVMQIQSNPSTATALAWNVLG